MGDLSSFCFPEIMLNMKILSKKVEKKLASVAKDLGISRGEALHEAVRLYRAHVDSSDLRRELIAWDAASAADFAAFEKKL